MTIREAGKGIVKKGYGYLNTYRIGFTNKNGESDETELDAEDMNDLAKLWSSLCSEFNCKANSVTYVEVKR
ncbi:hypothetical protein [Blautia sp. MSJ-19]|uniref:hypothetical protein n=1 Tax=Blautia sp. MSJ-19 TaxID=2841517 RepID=UPI001C0F2213|nr:hypothetical protein [Blautia sp. MSJ-19]MBU5481860.1 hypothetical protein [Blautia sp. MSJ-19]